MWLNSPNTHLCTISLHERGHFFLLKAIVTAFWPSISFLPVIQSTKAPFALWIWTQDLLLLASTVLTTTPTVPGASFIKMWEFYTQIYTLKIKCFFLSWFYVFCCVFLYKCLFIQSFHVISLFTWNKSVLIPQFCSLINKQGLCLCHIALHVKNPWFKT